MRRTFALFAVALASLAAAAMAVLLRPATSKPGAPPPVVPAVASATSAGLRMQALLERLYLPEDRNTSAYLQVDLVAGGDSGATRPRVPVNAVLILDRSGSMSGAKIEHAREAARALVQALGADDRLAIVEFSSGASVLLRSTALTAQVRSRARELIEALQPMGGTNLSAAFEVAAPELAVGRVAGRVDKVFLASDGQANEGIADRPGLLRLARNRFGSATLSTFGIGDDYDEDLMSALASQAGGRARYIDSPAILAGAFRAELSRAATLVARDVHLRVTGLSGASVDRVLGYDADGGWVRVPDFAAGEERRVLVKLTIPPGRGVANVAAVELTFKGATGEQQKAREVAQATFTSEAALLGQAPTQAAATGASVEMAELAQEAAQFREKGDGREARARLDAVNRVAARAAKVAPASSAQIARAATEYERLVEAIDAPGGAASKKVKARAFDAVRAPVAGW
jgi:Ca-activated chloride channel homolog